MRTLLFKIPTIIVAVLLSNIGYALPTVIPTSTQAETMLLSATILNRYHYSQQKLDDTISSRILENYLNMFDEDHMVFLQSDILAIQKEKNNFDDAISEGQLGLPFAIFALYQDRIQESLEMAQRLIDQPMDFTVHESRTLFRDKSPWPSSLSEREGLWTLRIKDERLLLKMAGNDAATIKKVLHKRYTQYFDHVKQMDAQAVFSSFMNAYTIALDPHSNYFGVQASQEFDVTMSLSLVGIGATLQSIDGQTVVMELTPGGPAALSNKIHVGDIISGIRSSGNIKKITPTQNMPIDRVVQLIRGKPHTQVTLEIIPAQNIAHPFTISLDRKKIALEDNAAKSTIITMQNHGKIEKIGIITVPLFYMDFSAQRNGDPLYKSVSRDVRTIILDFKKAKVDSILLDLRNNTGGSLDEAVKLTGLFISTGPVLQQRSSDGTITVNQDTDPEQIWAGPMGVLINQYSASATEIFAAAIQDYGRGVIIGEQSFGKGTVQSVLNLDEITQNKKPQYGEIKLTTEQFFRINGNTTQLQGVNPDITLPMPFDPSESRESHYSNALPWTTTPRASYLKDSTIANALPALTHQSAERVLANKEFSYIIEDNRRILKMKNDNRLSLNEQERMTENTLLAQQEAAHTGKNHMVLYHPNDGLQFNEMDRAKQKSSLDHHQPDAFLDEATHIVADLSELHTDPKAKSLLTPLLTLLNFLSL